LLVDLLTGFYLSGTDRTRKRTGPFDFLMVALPYSDPREICIETHLTLFASARGFQIYRWNLALTHITEVMGVQSSKNNRGDPYRFFDFFSHMIQYVSKQSYPFFKTKSQQNHNKIPTNVVFLLFCCGFV